MVLTSHVYATIKQDFKNELGLDDIESTPKDLGKSRIAFDESNVNATFNLISEWMNPFFHNEIITNMSSGVAARKETCDDLLRAEEVGKSCLKSFIEMRLIRGTHSFYEPIKKNKLSTFDDMIIKKKLKVNEGSIALKADQNTFARLLIIQRSRSIDLEKVLNFELSPYPLSLCHLDGTMTKTVKSMLFACLAEKIPQLTSVPQNTQSIYDGMVLFHKLPKTIETFGEISDYIIRKVLSGTCRVAFLPTDHYLTDAIKSLERDRRSTYGSITVSVSRREQVLLMQVSKFLQHPQNKLDLINFIIDDLQSTENTEC